MIDRLYRFRILREEPSHLLAALDEANGAQVWLAPIQFDAARRKAQTKELLAFAVTRKAEKFTANGHFYLVASSEAAARDLLTAALTSLSVGDEKKPKIDIGDEKKKDNEDSPEPPPATLNKTQLKALAALAVAAILVIILIAEWPSKTATPEFQQVNNTSGHTIQISDTTPNATIYYTTDGSTPSTSSTRYEDHHALSGITGGTSVRAIATAPGHSASDVGQKTVQISEAESDFYSGRFFYNLSEYFKAHDLFVESCKGNFLPACNFLGAMYTEGKGVEKDFPTAFRYFKKACDGGIAQGCANCGGLYERVGRLDVARKYYKQACAAGNETACNALRSLR
jgi:hypothetical protein